MLYNRVGMLQKLTIGEETLDLIDFTILTIQRGLKNFPSESRHLPRLPKVE